MNWCQEHWTPLVAAVKDAGLTALVADDGAEAAQKIARQLGGEDTNLTNYDPLLSAMLALTTFAYESMGPDNARRVILEGSCPVCIANHVHTISDCPHGEGCTWKVEDYYPNAVADEVERSKELLGGGP